MNILRFAGSILKWESFGRTFHECLAIPIFIGYNDTELTCLPAQTLPCNMKPAGACV